NHAGRARDGVAPQVDTPRKHPAALFPGRGKSHSGDGGDSATSPRVETATARRSYRGVHVSPIWRAIGCCPSRQLSGIAGGGTGFSGTVFFLLSTIRGILPLHC